MVRDQEVSPVGEDGEKQAHGDPVGQEGAGPSPMGRRDVSQRRRMRWLRPDGG